MRMHTNIAEFTGRRLIKQYNTAGTSFFALNASPGASPKAMGINAPTLRTQALGRAGKNGIVSFICLDGGNQVYTIWVWNNVMAALNSGNGWVHNGANSAEYTKTCDQLSKISFTIAEDEAFCITAGTTPVTELLVSGREDEAQANTDLTLGTTRYCVS